MAATECRDMVLERLTLGTLKSLAGRPGVKDVYLDEKSGVESHLLNAWETTNLCALPSDLKQFYLTSNGFLLKWKVKMKDEMIPLGHMEMNPLNRLERLVFSCGTTASSLQDIDLSEEEDPEGTIPHFDARSRLFELDSCKGLGKVCLVYRNTKQGVPAKSAEYWFLDKALQWHYITNSFQAYFRLMLKNLGLPQWQYLFTETGVSPRVQQWYSLCLPVSSDINMDNGLPNEDGEQGEVISNTNNPLDCARVFRGKERKKTTNQQASLSSVKKKVISPVPNKSSSARGTVQKSATNPLAR